MISWEKIENSSQYDNLSMPEKEKVKSYWFEKNVAPHTSYKKLSDENKGKVQSHFFSTGVSDMEAVSPIQDKPSDKEIKADSIRPDGTQKGPGYLGTLKRPDGGESTELSATVNFDGKEQLIPLLVPTLEKKQIDYLLTGKKPTKAIVNKAVEHAMKRLEQGKSVFAQKRERSSVKRQDFDSQRIPLTPTQDEPSARVKRKPEYKKPASLLAGPALKTGRDIAVGVGRETKKLATNIATESDPYRAITQAVSDVGLGILGFTDMVAGRVTDIVRQALDDGIINKDEAIKVIKDSLNPIKPPSETDVIDIDWRAVGKAGEERLKKYTVLPEPEKPLSKKVQDGLEEALINSKKGLPLSEQTQNNISDAITSLKEKGRITKEQAPLVGQVLSQWQYAKKRKSEKPRQARLIGMSTVGDPGAKAITGVLASVPMGVGEFFNQVSKTQSNPDMKAGLKTVGDIAELAAYGQVFKTFGSFFKKSETFYNLPIKERGLVVQDIKAKQDAGWSEGDILSFLKRNDKDGFKRYKEELIKRDIEAAEKLKRDAEKPIEPPITPPQGGKRVAPTRTIQKTKKPQEKPLRKLTPKQRQGVIDETFKEEQYAKESTQEIKPTGKKERIEGKEEGQVRIRDTEQAQEVKEPWKMTRDEFGKSKNISIGKDVERIEDIKRLNAELKQLESGKEQGFKVADTPKQKKHLKERIEAIKEQIKIFESYLDVSKQHQASIKQALSEGKPVPKEVLAEYPDLQEQPTKKQKALQEYKAYIETLSDKEKTQVSDLIEDEPARPASQLQKIRKVIQAKKADTPKTTQQAAYADTGGYATTGGFKKGEAPESLLESIDLPELTEFAKELGDYPAVKKKLSRKLAKGLFRPKGKGRIELLAELGKNPEELKGVLAHEIGHWIDYVPEKTMARGNILGRMASFKKFMKGTLPHKPGLKTILTKQDRARLRRQAEKLIGKENEEWIDEVIRKEMPVTPQQVLDIWNSVDELLNKKLTDYIKTLNTPQKKAIVRDALKGVVPEELKKYASVTEEKTGKKIKKEITEKERKERVRKKYADLINKEVKKRELFTREKVTDELKALTREWKPFNPNIDPKYTKYRYSSPELYADAISVLFNKPGLLKAKAPNFYKGFFNYLDSKPKVKRIYESIQEGIKKRPEELARQRKERYIAGEKRGLKARREAIEKQKKIEVPIIESVLTWLSDKNEPALRRIRKFENRKDALGRQAYSLRVALEELSNVSTKIDVMVSDVKTKILKRLRTEGINPHDLGYYLFQKRIIGERFDYANPGGNYEELSEHDLKIIEKDWGEAKTKSIKEMAEDFRKIREDTIIPQVKEGQIATPELMEYIENTKDYVTFSVHKWLKDKHGGGTTARIYEQVGTFSEIENPVIATLFKDISLFRAAEMNKVKMRLEQFSNQHGLMKPAKTNRFGKPEHPPPGEEILTVLHKGKPVHYYGEKNLVNLANMSPRQAHAIEKVMRFLGRPPREVFVSKNPGWMIMNMPKDYLTTVKNLEAVQIRSMPELARKYKKAYPEVVRYIFKGIMSPDIRAMAERGMFPKQRMWGGVDKSVQEEMLGMMEETIGEFEPSKESASKAYAAKEKVKQAWGGADKAASTTELVSKLAAFKFLIKNTDKGLSKIGQAVRNQAGTPNISKKGVANTFTNNIFPFSTVHLSGLKAASTSFKENPKAYAFKTFMFNLLPKTIKWGFRTGVVVGAMQFLSDNVDDLDDLDDDEKEKLKEEITGLMDGAKHIQRMLRNIPLYDLSHYNCIPLWINKQGKTVYLRIPEDYEGQYISNIAAKLMDKKIMGTDGALAGLAKHSPYNPNPWLFAPYKLYNYAVLGQPVLDSWHGYNVLTRQEREAGGKWAAKRLVKWSWSEIGGDIVYKPTWDGLETDRTAWEEFLNTFPGNILGRFVKISDRGVYERIQERFDEVDKRKARASLEMKERLIQFVELMDGEQITVEEFTKAASQLPHRLHNKVKRLINRKCGNAYMRALNRANSWEKKLIVMDEMLKNNFTAEELKTLQRKK